MNRFKMKKKVKDKKDMKGSGAKQKGKKGEQEACEWLRKHLFENQVVPQPNHNQIYIGCDIIVPPFIIEVKRQETLYLDKWWIQIQKVDKHLLNMDREFISVVMFRQNHREWEFLIDASAIGCERGYVRLGRSRFLEWAKKYRFNQDLYREKEDG